MRTFSLFTFAFYFSLSFSLFAAPRIGVTVNFAYELGEGRPLGYRSDEIFRTRPICEEMIREGVDPYLFTCKVPKDMPAALRQFDAIWLMTDHEDSHMAQQFDPDRMGAALRQYVEEGGGLVLNLTGGRYPQNIVDGWWRKCFSHLDMETLLEETYDRTSKRETDGHSLFYTTNFTAHPVTEGVPGLWLASRQTTATHGGSMGVIGVRYSSDWQVVVRGPKEAQTFKKGEGSRVTDFTQPGTYASEPPVIAVRTLGKGRIVAMAIAKDNSCLHWNIGNWPNYTERDEFEGRKTDLVRLLVNACKWAGGLRPRRDDGFKPFKAANDGWYQTGLCDADHAAHEKVAYPKMPSKYGWTPDAVMPNAVGVIGLHSSYSDGSSTVAEYVAEAKKLGLTFVVFTDPLDRLTPAKLAQLKADCSNATDKAFYAVPGVEYTDASGVEWLQFHDKVEFPSENLIQGKWKAWDGKVMQQQNNYGGYQNLYRGVIRNMGRFKELGIDTVTLGCLSGAVPVAYDVDSPVCDNWEAMRELSRDLYYYTPYSYTRVTKAADLARAKAAATTCVRLQDRVSRIVNAEGKTGGELSSGTPANAFVRTGSDLAIGVFHANRIPGTDLCQVIFCAFSKKGVRDVEVIDSDSRVLAHFDGKGATRFEREFVFSLDRQCYPQLVVRDAAGATAWSAPRYLNNYHAGLHRCGDNQNMLSLRPDFTYYMNWDCQATPYFQRLHLPRDGHAGCSEGGAWNPNPKKRKAERGLGSNSGKTDVIGVKGADFPGKTLCESCRNVFTLVEPNAVTIVDQYVGEALKPRTEQGPLASFTNCSVPRRVAENPYYRYRRRIYRWTPRLDTYVYWTRFLSSPDYEGDSALVEGEIEFLKDFEFSRPIHIVGINVTNPEQNDLVLGTRGRLGPGDWAVRTPGTTHGWLGVVGVKDGGPVFVEDRKINPTFHVMSVLVGETGKVYRAGTKLAYRFVTITSPMDLGADGAYLKRFAETVNRYGPILELTAKDGCVERKLGPDAFIEDYPVRVAGLVDNGTAYAISPKGLMRPMGFADGFAYQQARLEDGGTWWFGNLYLADNADLRLCYIPAIENHEKAELRVHNPTEKEIAATVRDVRTGQTIRVTVPARDSVKVNR